MICSTVLKYLVLYHEYLNDLFNIKFKTQTKIFQVVQSALLDFFFNIIRLIIQLLSSALLAVLLTLLVASLCQTNHFHVV